MPRKNETVEVEAQPEAPSHLKFVGRPDYFVSGVPQSDLKVVDEPQAHDEVAPAHALDLLATGLYVAMTVEEYDAAHLAAFEEAEA